MTLVKRPTLDRMRDLLGVVPKVSLDDGVRLVCRRVQERLRAGERPSVSMPTTADAAAVRAIARERHVLLSAGMAAPVPGVIRVRMHAINLADRRWRRRALQRRSRRRVARRSRSSMLHSVFSNAHMLAGRFLEAVSGLPQPKAFFIGNEYKLMPEKMAFCDALGVALLVSQSSSPAVHDLYRERLGCAVIGIPNTGFDPRCSFQPPMPSTTGRSISGTAPTTCPCTSATTSAATSPSSSSPSARSLRTCASTFRSIPPKRLGETEWAAFLNRCRGQLGSEAGGDYFELDDASAPRCSSISASIRDVTTDEVTSRFFATPPARAAANPERPERRGGRDEDRPGAVRRPVRRLLSAGRALHSAEEGLQQRR